MFTIMIDLILSVGLFAVLILYSARSTMDAGSRI